MYDDSKVLTLVLYFKHFQCPLTKWAEALQSACVSGVS